ncbi:MAG: hypothetical protein O3B22_00260 [Proteobacteria bacterium]|nr:hypothetical protein [Pseudomonadota bacterium]
MPQAQSFIDHDDTNIAAFEVARRPSEYSDRELAQDVTATMLAFQEAMDRAILAGLIVEPSFQAVGNRFSAVGVSAGSYLVKARILRRLS